MKDETNGVPIDQGALLKAKMYSILYRGMEKKRAKGVKKYVVSKYLRHSMYRDVLLNTLSLHHSMTMFRTHHHQINTVVQNKISLSAYEDKRFIGNDGITSLAYGHCDIPFYDVSLD